jgi:hypothetical protein
VAAFAVIAQDGADFFSKKGERLWRKDHRLLRNRHTGERKAEDTESAKVPQEDSRHRDYR